MINEEKDEVLEFLIDAWYQASEAEDDDLCEYASNALSQYVKKEKEYEKAHWGKEKYKIMDNGDIMTCPKKVGEVPGVGDFN